MINRGKSSAWKRSVGAVMALGLVAGACSSSSGDESAETDDSVVEADDAADAGDDAADDAGDDAGDDAADDAADAPDDTVEVVQSEGGKLAAVQAAGELRCGGNETLPGFGIVDSEGAYSGFDIDYCRVVAAAVLGDADAVVIVPLNADARFPSLQSGDVDVLIRNTTWTGSRDGEQGANFLFTTFYDGQGMMVPASSGFTELEDLADASICVLSGTTTELNLTAVFNARGIPFTPVVFADNTALQPAYESGQCEAWTSDASQLAAFKFAIEDLGGDEQSIMAEVISKEPLGPVVADGDTEWAQAVNWAVMSTVQAWEFGLDSSSVASYSGDDPSILAFTGQADNPAAGLGLSDDFAVQVVSQVGNYEEIYTEHIVPIGLSLEGSPNDLWTNGGLMYVPPFR
jgi:general L-amino acid transport system substrate-binding protein